MRWMQELISLLPSRFLTESWIAARFLLSKKKKILSTTGWVSLLGLIIGVASLVVSMAVISGFETTLQKSVTDVAGHLQIYKFHADEEDWHRDFARVKKFSNAIEAATPIAIIEGVLAHNSKLSGIFIHGVDEQLFTNVLHLEDRLIAGHIRLASQDGIPQVLIGMGIAKDFSLQPGDEFRVVVPINSELDVTKFRRHLGKFKVAGILDFGKYDYNQRLIFSSLTAVQSLAEIGNKYSGLILKLDDFKKADAVTFKLEKDLGSEYRFRTWREVNQNLFEAVKIEKVVIFFVIFIIVIAAAFNVASSLYINVVKSYPEIGILKTLGMTQEKIIKIFSIQGLLLGGIGCVIGVLLGFSFCAGFMFLENYFGIIAGSVYKVERIYVQVRVLDIFAIIFATLFICFIATWAPAKRAAKLTPVEGLRYE